MRVLIFSSSPNTDGLTAACATAALEGVQQAGGVAEEIRINDLNIKSCEACDDGWGTCRDDHLCNVLDDFQALHERTLKADAYVFVTPVYWGDLSESMKAFTDRLRRCEAPRGDESGLCQKPVIMVAAAGGSGNGMITCLASLERWIQHVRARKSDFIPVNRWNREYKLETIRSASDAMIKSL
ncbi:flavodoxin family protein [Chloroflexota bacterium]